MMRRRHFLSFSALALAAACTPGGSNMSGDLKPVMRRSYDLQRLRFSALPGLVVSEDESFYPNADIVWRGDPVGPRIPQIAAMFQTAADRNQSVLTGEIPVDVAITLVRFHGVTDRTRLTVGGVYNIVFNMAVLNARTGAIIEPSRRVVGNLSAPGGTAGLMLGDQGLTQKVRVTDFLTGLLRQQLT